jgi:tetratricopeptide (TPR) repeat protein
MFMSAMTFESGKNLINMLILTGVVLTGYCTLQYFDSNLVIKSSGFKIIGTLGNPNYVSTLLGVISTLFVWKFLHTQNKLAKFGLTIALISALFVVKNSESSQGIFIFVTCSLFYAGMKIFFANKKLGITFFSLLIPLLVIGIFGLVQRGPLAQLLYQYSISLRGDYWRVAISMFKSNILSGVGIERYGIEFQNYRDATAALRSSASLTDDPHNEILYFLSSGGILLTLSYFLVLVLILAISIYGLRNTNLRNREHVLILLTAWIGFRIESLISVNQVTNNVIEWIIAGSLIALSIDLKLAKEKNIRMNNFKNNYLKNLVTLSLTLIFTLIIIVPKLRADSNYSNYNQNLVSGMSKQTLIEKKAIIIETINQSPYELIYRDAATRFMINTNDLENARILVDSLIQLDSKYYSAYELEAEIFEREGNLESAINSRLIALNLDPYDIPNILSLKKLYLSLDNVEESSKIQDYLNKLNLNPDLITKFGLAIK